MELTRNAYAKINLFLDITGRRADGYHTITGVMQAVSLCDRVTVAVEEPVGRALCSLGACPGRAERIVLTCTNPTLPTDARNLAWRAAEAFFAATGRGCRRLTIHIDKHIPAAAGLAGGSTDAAAVLSALNTLFDEPLTPQALGAVGLTLGADVPFCLCGGTHLTEGIGEVLTPMAPLPPCRVIVACAGEGISTPAAYRALDERYGQFAPGAYHPENARLRELTDALARGDSEGICAHVFNLFESVILPTHDTARAIKRTLTEAGARTAMMSGSGPSVFGIFHPDSGDDIRALRALEAQGIPAWVCEPVR